MIHIATVHVDTDRWIDIQLRYLERHVDCEYRLYTCLDVAHERHRDKFFFARLDPPGNIPKKLDYPPNRPGWTQYLKDYLAQTIVENAAPDDLLVFLDGDAFPVADLAAPLEDMLARRPLAAIRRDENLMDPQPHPSFCATTVRFWTEIGGTWERASWRNAEGALVADAGGRLFRILAERRIEWTPLLRSNVRNLHPLLFGIYGDLIYHHGAGFRSPFTRVDRARMRQEHYASETPEAEPRLYEKLRTNPSWPSLREARAKENERLSEQVFQAIQRNDDFATELFLSPEPARANSPSLS
jgi:hypothetical protein